VQRVLVIVHQVDSFDDVDFATIWPGNACADRPE
jgi:hypothetical protein